MQVGDAMRRTKARTPSDKSLKTILRRDSPINHVELNATPLKQGPIAFKKLFTPKNLPLITVEINWERWKKDEKFNPNQPLTSRQPSRKASPGDAGGFELASERVEMRENRGMKTTRKSNTRESSPNSFDRKVRAAEFITTLRDSCLRKNYSSSEFVLAERSDVKRAFRALEFIAQYILIASSELTCAVREESLYADLMKNTIQILRVSLFFQRGMLEQFSDYWNRVESQDLKNVISKHGDSKLSLPYLNLCILLLQEIRLKDEKHSSAVLYYERLVASHKEKINVLQEQMAVELERLNNQVIVELMAKQEQEKTDFESYRHTLLSEISLLRTLLDNEKYEKDQCKDQIKLQDVDKKSLETMIKELKEEIRLRDALIKEKNSKIDGMQNQVKSFKKTLDENIDQLARVKELTGSLKREKDELLFQRDSLKGRAAVAFEELTPRPNYQKIMEEKKVELGIKTDMLWREKNSKVKLRTEQIFEGMIIKYMNALKTNQELEKQLKKSQQISDPSPSPTGRKRSISIKNPLTFNNRSPRPSVTSTGNMASKFSTKDLGGVIPKITINKQESFPNGIDEADSNKSDSQFGEGESDKKQLSSFKLADNPIEASPFASKGMLGSELFQADPHSSLSHLVSPDSRKEIQESKEQDEEQPLTPNGVLRIDLPEALGINKDSDADKIILQKADDLVVQITQTRDALQKFYQKNSHEI